MQKKEQQRKNLRGNSLRKSNSYRKFCQLSEGQNSQGWQSHSSNRPLVGKKKEKKSSIFFPFDLKKPNCNNVVCTHKQFEIRNEEHSSSLSCYSGSNRALTHLCTKTFDPFGAYEVQNGFSKRHGAASTVIFSLPVPI